MKCFRAGILAALIVTLFMVGFVQAGQRESAIYISPMLGYHVFEGDQNTDDSISGGFSLGYNVSKRWAAELEVRYTPTETDQKNVSSEDIEIWSAGVNALYHFNPDGPLVPYVLAGFGGMYFSVDGYEDDKDFMMNWGVGGKYFISEDTALRLDLRHVLDMHSDREWDHNGDDNIDNNLIATAGLYWQFGGTVPPPPKPSDTDQDGIYDVRDKCPDTPLGVMVDAVGCPPSERSQPPPVFVDGDDDGDGVLNSWDKCPGTASDVIVDENGCPIKFTMQVEFDFDKSEIRPEYHGKLQEVSDFINKYPGAKFLLAGHTDSIGTDGYNQALSMRRAAKVKQYLVEEFGIAAHLMTPRAYGETEPIDSNDTKEGRQRNRRVEVIYLEIILPE